VLSSFKLTRSRLFLYGRPARVTFRIDSRSRTVNVRLYLRPAEGGRPVSTIRLGARRTRVTQSYLLTGRETGVLPQGRYVLRIAARDRRGRRLRRAASASSVAELGFFHHRFPLVGSFSYGGADSRFGAPRRGHRHQGQDLSASSGTPIVAPRGGVIKTVAYQASGGGHYAVLHGQGERRDYVFMHMRTGSVVVHEGQRVRTGQRIGEVGSTGESSGPHLHFEVWSGAWYSGGHPVDPLPLLKAWDRWS
jgi:murein DD-endopeptidase MepM/ murein hydrolase activator NlpD